MQIVIDIPEDVYNRIALAPRCASLLDAYNDRDMFVKAIQNGTPLDDCISREKAKRFLYERLDRLNDDELYDIFSRIIDDMYNELPSIIHSIGGKE